MWVSIESIGWNIEDALEGLSKELKSNLGETDLKMLVNEHHDVQHHLVSCDSKLLASSHLLVLNRPQVVYRYQLEQVEVDFAQLDAADVQLMRFTPFVAEPRQLANDAHFVIVVLASQVLVELYHWKSALHSDVKVFNGKRSKVTVFAELSNLTLVSAF